MLAKGAAMDNLRYLVFCLILSSFLQSSELFIDIDDPEEEAYQRSKGTQTCHIEGMAGNHPFELCALIRHFSAISLVYFRNSFLLYGPPGTGKSCIAERIAHQADAKFIRKSAASMVTSMQGSGAEAIRVIFDNEVDPALNEGKVVLFIDEIDAFTKARSFHSNDDHVNALLELMQKVTEYKDKKKTCNYYGD